MSQKTIIIALYDDLGCGCTPPLPYVGTRFDGGYFTRRAKQCLAAALLRCGFDVVDCNADGGATDIQEFASRINRRPVDAGVALSFGAFGSRKNFNDVRGFCVKRFAGRFAQKSRVLCEDIYARLTSRGRTGTIVSECAEAGANCPVAVVDAGYLTNFDEAKLVYDCDFTSEFAETIATAVCEHFDMPYVKRDDVLAYPILGVGRRGNKVKLLQYLLCFVGETVSCDGVYDGETASAVKRFCAECGKQSDGSVTPPVWRDLLMPDPCVSFGATGCAVRYIQSKLLSKLYRIKVDGIFGNHTLDALNEFLAETNADIPPVTRSDTIGAEIFKLLSPVGGGRPRLY